MRCSRCGAAYCGPNCQRRSWKEHKAFCINFKIAAHKEEQLAKAQVPACASSESTAESAVSDGSEPCTFDDLTPGEGTSVSWFSQWLSVQQYPHEGTDTSSSEVTAKIFEARTFATTEVTPIESQAEDSRDSQGGPELFNLFADERSDAGTQTSRDTGFESQEKEIHDVNDIWKEVWWEEAYNCRQVSMATTVVSPEATANEVEDASDADMESSTNTQNPAQKMQTSADDGCCMPPAATLMSKAGLLPTSFKIDAKFTDALVTGKFADALINGNCPIQ